MSSAWNWPLFVLIVMMSPAPMLRIAKIQSSSEMPPLSTVIALPITARTWRSLPGSVSTLPLSTSLKIALMNCCWWRWRP